MVVLGRPHTFFLFFLAASGISFVVGLGGSPFQVANVRDNLGGAFLGSRITGTPALVNRQVIQRTTTTRRTTTTTCTTTRTETLRSTNTTITSTFAAVSTAPITTTVVSSASGNVGQAMVDTTLRGTTSRSTSSDSQTTTQMTRLQNPSQQPSANSTILSSSTAAESTPATAANLGASSMRATYIGIAVGTILALLLFILGFVLVLRRCRSNARNLNPPSCANRATDVTPYNIPPPSSGNAHDYDLEKMMISAQQRPEATGSGEYHSRLGQTPAGTASSTFTSVESGLKSPEDQSAINQRIRVVRDEMMHLQAKLPSEEPLARRAVWLVNENSTTGGGDAEITMEKMREMVTKLQDQVARLQMQQQVTWATRLSMEPPPDYERDQDESTEGESKTEVP